MGITDRFHALTDEQQRAVAAVAAGRVLPILRYELDRSGAVFEDGLRLVWIELEGRPVTRQDYARVLNAALATVPAEDDDHHAARLAGLAMVSVIEGAQHNSDVLVDALTGALAAVTAFAGDEAAEAEERWQGWAVSTATGLDRPTRHAFTGRDAPRAAWLDQVGAADLPLWKGAEE